MRVLTVLTEEDHRAALQEARNVANHARLDPTKLNAPIDDAVESWFRRIWDQIEDGIRSASRGAVDQARALKDEAAELWSKAETELGRRSNELRSKLIAAIETYLRSVVDRALNLVRPAIEVGGATLKIKSVKVEQDINLSLSLKITLDELIDFVADGKLSVSAEYGIA
jgi:hypothetical protein